MKNRQVDFFSHRLLPPIVTDYLAGNDFLKPFYKYIPSYDSVPSVIKDKSGQKIDRNLLSEILTKQYSSINPSEKVKENISLLKSEKTFTVTTGHQLNLFTGPLYFIYKILTTIQLAAKFSERFPEYRFVPVYWMATEDHDFEEINHIHLFGEKLEWQKKGIKNAGGPSGKLGTENIEPLIELIGQKIKNENGSEKVIELLRNAYVKHHSLAAATQYLVNELFGKYGLLILDANERQLKEKFAEVMKDDLLNHTSFKLVNETSKRLEEKYDVQVHPREINLFYMTDNSRERIAADDKKYLKELETAPEKLSPNVVLRPLYQEMLLPNVAIVGGPAEIAYWLQYKKMLEYYNVNFPMLVLRKSFMFLDEKVTGVMKQLNLNVEDLFLPVDDLINNFIDGIPGVNLDDERKAIEKSFLSVIEKLSSTDATLKSSAEAEREKALQSIEKLELKLRKAEKNKHDIEIGKIKKLKEKLFPEGMPQERYENFIPYYLKYREEFFEMLLSNGDVFDFKLNVLHGGKTPEGKTSEAAFPPTSGQ